MVDNDVLRTETVVGIDSIIIYSPREEIVYNGSDLADFEEFKDGIIIKLTSGKIKLYRNTMYSINGKNNAQYLHNISLL